jgi:hypothetical protein
VSLIAVFIVGALAYYFIFMKKAGNLDFWKLVNSHPIQALAFFESESCWYVDEKPGHRDVSGPFLFFHPLLNRSVKLYCDANQIDASQQRFMSEISLQGRT